MIGFLSDVPERRRTTRASVEARALVLDPTLTAGSEQRTLATGGARVERVEPGFVTRALGILSNPNVAFILLMIGIYGLIFEFMNPGARILPFTSS